MSKLCNDFISKSNLKYVSDIVSKHLSNDTSHRVIETANKSPYGVLLILLSGVSFCHYIYTHDSCINIGVPDLKTSDIKNIQYNINDDMEYKTYLIDLQNEIKRFDSNNDKEIQSSDFIVALDALHSMENVDVQADVMYQFKIDNKDNIIMDVKYNSALYNKKTINLLVDNLVGFYSYIMDNPEDILHNISLVSNIEKKILDQWNYITGYYPEQESFIQLFKEQVNTHKQKTAAFQNDIEISYDQLDKKSDIIAGCLRSRGIQKNAVVAVMLDRSIDLLITILAIFKAGGVYLPLDAKIPDDRISQIIKDSSSSVVIVHNRYIDRIKCASVAVFEEAMQTNDGSIPVNDYSPNDLAYIIYTSGTTGSPKGVMVQHKGMVNHLYAKINDLGITEKSIVVQNASQCFDISIWQMLAALAVGGIIAIYEDSIVYNPSLFIDCLKKDKITVLEVVPSFLSVMLSCLEEQGCVNINLEYIIITGEELKLEVRRWQRIYPGIQMVNAYGPTEASDDITHCFINDEAESVRVPIGKPVQNMKIYILDKNNHLCPIGALGEILVSGVGVGCGYLNDAEKTSINYHYINLDNGLERVYRTGDLGRWRDDGQIEYFGRIDNQIKIRGYRIELSEIENCILSIDEIDNAAAVLCSEDENSFLCAYVISKSRVNADKIKNIISKSLPQYMIPNHIIQISEFPQNVNGKIDRKALAALKIKKPDPINRINENKTMIEKMLIETWEDVLGKNNIQTDTNFFDLGGDSIKAIQISAKLLKHNIKLEVHNFFDHPTIKELCGFVEEVNQVLADYWGHSPLSPAQSWFFDEQLDSVPYYNQAVMLHSNKHLDIEIIENIFEKIVESHGSLRARIIKQTDTYEQYFEKYRKGLFTLDYFDFSDNLDYQNTIVSAANSIHQGIDCFNGPVMKLGLFKTMQGDYLLISIHHLFVDGISWRIIINDFTDAYKSFGENKEINIVNEIGTLNNWIERLIEYSNKINEETIQWWKRFDNVPNMPLPIDNISSLNEETTIILEKLDSNTTTDLMKKATNYYKTDIAVLLLTSFGMTIRKHSNSDQIIVNCEGHGRESLFDDIHVNNTVGWFTSMYPVFLHADENDLHENVKKIKEELSGTPNKGMDYGLIKYLSSGTSKSQIEVNHPQINFNYLGAFDNELNEDNFTYANISVGETMSPKARRPYSIEVITKIVQSELEININYSNKQFNEKFMLSIIHDFKDNIIRMLQIDEKETELAVNDFILKNINSDKIDELKGFLKTIYSDNVIIQNIYPLLPAAERILFYSLFYKKANYYYEQLTLDIIGDFDIKIFNSSFQKIVDHYEVFRSIFLYRFLADPVQVIIKNLDVDVGYYDFCYLNETKDHEVDNFIKSDLEKGFDPGKGQLFRISILKLDNKKYKFVFTFHHILMDGWSLGIILNEIFSAYSHQRRGMNVEFSGPGTNYNFYVWYENNKGSFNEVFWKNYLNEYKYSLASKVKDDVQKYNNSKKHQLSGDSDRIRELCKKNRITLNTFFQAIVSLALQQMLGVDDIVFNFVISGRDSAVLNIESMVGLFSNSLPVRFNNTNDVLFSEYLKNTQKTILQVEKSSLVSTMKILETVGLPNHIVDIVMAFENYPQIKENENNSIQISDVRLYEKTHYNLNLIIIPDSQITIKIDYNGKVYNDEMIDKFIAYCDQMIKNVLNNHEKIFNEIIRYEINE